MVTFTKFKVVSISSGEIKINDADNRSYSVRTGEIKRIKSDDERVFLYSINLRCSISDRGYL
jgi:hypothetical protein